MLLLSPFADDIVDLVIEEGKVVTTGAGTQASTCRFHEARDYSYPLLFQARP